MIFAMVSEKYELRQRLSFCFFGTLLTACLFVLAVPCFAQESKSPRVDHAAIQDNLPNQLDDAVTVPDGTRQLQMILRYERTHEKTDRAYWEPRLDWGFAPGWEARLSSQFLGGSAERTNSGDVQVEFLRTFTQNTARLPALGVAVRAELPSGRESEGTDTLVEGHLSRELRENDPAKPTIHLNVGWLHNARPREEEKADGWRLVAGYSRSLAAGKNTGTTIVIDYAGEEEPHEAATHHLAEIGLRRQVSQRFVWSVGLAAGLGGDSPPIRANVGTQWAL